MNKMKKIAVLFMLATSAYRVSGQAGSLDTNFKAPWLVQRESTREAYGVSIGPDRKIVMVGNVRTIDESRYSVIRFNPNGTVDTSLNAYGFNAIPRNVKVLSNGSMLICGSFTSYRGVPNKLIIKLLPNGDPDNSFKSKLTQGYMIQDLYVQPDGKIYVMNMIQVVRLMPNGDVDPQFDQQSTLDNEVKTVGVQSDGKVIVGGSFKTYKFKKREYFMRFHSDGTEDTSTFLALNKLNGSVDRILVQSDDKIVVAGGFTKYGTTNVLNCIRLFPDGSLDTSFQVNPDITITNRMLLDSQDRILNGTGFYPKSPFVKDTAYFRLNKDGDLDSTYYFIYGFGGSTQCTALQPDGKLVFVGRFSNYGTFPNSTITTIFRLHGDSTWDDSTTYYTSQASACDSFSWRGTTYTQSGTYRLDLTNSQGDDSLLVLELNLSHSSSNLEQVKTCGPYLWQGQTYSTPGNYTKTLSNAQGCDSILKLDLAISPINKNISLTGNIFISSELDTGVSYQWIDCSTGQFIQNMTSRLFMPQTYGTFAVIIYKWGCIDTSYCMSNGPWGILSPEAIEMNVYPNPAGKEITVDLPLDGEGGELILYNSMGQVLSANLVQNEGTFNLTTSELPEGVYWLLYHTARGNYKAKFIKTE